VTARDGARYERVLADREPFFVKRLSPASDWIMRVTGDHVHRPYLAWRSGRFRAALEAGGVGTGSWREVQLDLCLLAIMATFGWEKALGDAAGLSWWESAVAGAAARQGIGVPGPPG
jgi:hypothetical protein